MRMDYFAIQSTVLIRGIDVRQFRSHWCALADMQMNVRFRQHHGVVVQILIETRPSIRHRPRLLTLIWM